jgi:hypothetical protein
VCERERERERKRERKMGFYKIGFQELFAWDWL